MYAHMHMANYYAPPTPLSCSSHGPRKMRIVSVFLGHGTVYTSTKSRSTSLTKIDILWLNTVNTMTIYSLTWACLNEQKQGRFKPLYLGGHVQVLGGHIGQ